MEPETLSARLAGLWSRRELVLALAGRDLRMRYKGSVLGWLWSLAHPLALAAVYTIAFRIVFRIPIPHYAFFVLAGLLPWLFVSASLSVATGAIVDQGPLVKKVAFPREALPLAVVLSQFTHFAIAYLVVVPLLGAIEVGLTPAALLVPLLMVPLALFTAGLALLASALQVRFRDTRHLVEVMLQIWFWLTPILYGLSHVPERYRGLYALNPLSPFVTSLRDVLVEGRPPSGSDVALLAMWAVLSASVGYAFFTRRQARFAEHV